MAYRNKTYVGFDADTDMRYYRLMQAWKNNQNIDFVFYNVHDINPNPRLTSEQTIKRQLRERFRNTNKFVLLVGTKTRNLFKYVRWEIEQAIKLNLPIIVVNLNGKRKLDTELCPPIVRDELAIHVSFNSAIVQHALADWPQEHQVKCKNGESESYSYSDSVYKRLGI